MKRLDLLIVFTLLLLGFTSCSDAKLAKEMEGTWHVTLNMKDYEGTPYTQEQFYEFTNVKSDSKDGGTFIERTVNPIEEEVEGIAVKYTATSVISGEWEVLFGDLYMTYNLSSFDVFVDDVDYKFSDNIDYGTALDYMGAAIASAMFGQELIDKEELAKEIRKEVYKSLYEEYEQQNRADREEGASYANLKIENGIMSFDTYDIGRMQLNRVDSDK